MTNQQPNHTFLCTLTLHAVLNQPKELERKRGSASLHAAFIARLGLQITTEITTTYGRRPTMTLLLRIEAGLTPTVSMRTRVKQTD